MLKDWKVKQKEKLEEFTKNTDIPNNADNIHVTIYIDLNPAIKYIKYVKKSYNQCGYV